MPFGAVRDPVCGMNVSPDSLDHKETCAGHRYQFCSAGCLAKSQSEPARYVGEGAKT